LDAIRNHTVGRQDPSDLLVFLMLADLTEPGRDYPGVEELRDLALKDPLVALLSGTQKKLEHIIDKGRTPHPRATRMLESLRVRSLT
jgi:HD superfamily phosphohydrolase YqeK